MKNKKETKQEELEKDFHKELRLNYDLKKN